MSLLRVVLTARFEEYECILMSNEILLLSNCVCFYQMIFTCIKYIVLVFGTLCCCLSCFPEFEFVQTILCQLLQKHIQNNRSFFQQIATKFSSKLQKSSSAKNPVIDHVKSILRSIRVFSRYSIESIEGIIRSIFKSIFKVLFNLQEYFTIFRSVCHTLSHDC